MKPFVLALLALLVYVRAARRFWRRLVGGLGRDELRRREKEKELARRAWRESPLIEGRWTLWRSISILMATAMLASTTISCSGEGALRGGAGPGGIPALAVSTAGMADTIDYLHADHLGAVQVVTNNSGTEVHRKRFAPFGDSFSGSESGGSESDTGFAATREEPAGLLRMGNRFYDPKVARFTSADPVQFEAGSLMALRLIESDFQSGQKAPSQLLDKRMKRWRRRIAMPQDLNRYSYVINNPLGVVDVDGYAPVATEGSIFRAQVRKIKKAKGDLFKAAIGFLVGALTFGITGGVLGAMIGSGRGPIPTFNALAMLAISGLTILAGALIGSKSLISAGISSAQAGIIALVAGASVGDAWKSYGIGFGTGLATPVVFSYGKEIAAIIGTVWHLPNTLLGMAVSLVDATGRVVGNLLKAGYSLLIGDGWSFAEALTAAGDVFSDFGIDWVDGYGPYISYKNSFLLNYLNSGNTHGLALGNVLVFKNQAALREVLLHELSHVHQGWVLGPFYLPTHITLQATQGYPNALDGGAPGVAPCPICFWK